MRTTGLPRSSPSTSPSYAELEDLHRQIRWMRRTLAAILIFIGVAISIAMRSSDTPDRIRARGLELVDGSGRTYATIGTEEGRTFFRLMRHDGSRLLTTEEIPELGGMFQLYDRAGTPGCTLYTNHSGGALTLWTTDRKNAVQMTAGPVLGGTLLLSDGEGAPGISVVNVDGPRVLAALSPGSLSTIWPAEAETGQ